MTRKAAPHHRGPYKTRAKYVRAYANANPDTRCMSCHLTITEIRRTKPDAQWTAGHVNDGEINGVLLPECGPCNYGRGAAMGNTRRHAPNVSRTW